MEWEGDGFDSKEDYKPLKLIGYNKNHGQPLIKKNHNSDNKSCYEAAPSPGGGGRGEALPWFFWWNDGVDIWDNLTDANNPQ